MIWDALNRVRGEAMVDIDNTKLLELIAATQGVERLHEILNDNELLKNILRHFSFSIPHYVINFIFDLINTIKPKSHLDPWVTLTSPIVQKKFESSLAICLNQQEDELIKAIFKDNCPNIILGQSLAVLDKITTTFDFISCFPPFGMKIPPILIKGQKLSLDFSATLLIKSAYHLNENGVGVFLMSPSFMLDKIAKENLETLGVRIQAVFSIPAGAFAPRTSMSSNLILFSKAYKGKTFVAELSEDIGLNKTVIDNFINQKEGKVIQLGTFVDFENFISLQKLIFENELSEMVRRIGYPPVLLAKITLEINSLKAKTSEEVNHLSNSIYLPKIGNSPIVTHPEFMKIKPHNYYQIQLNPEEASSVYLANYFNSQIGSKLRESLEVGGVIMQIPKSQLFKCLLHIPDLKTQIELIEVSSKIDQFTLRLGELKRNLWRQPKSLRTIQKEVKSINQEEKLEHWIDKLPFPISSILWRYYATSDYTKKIEHLFHFFEALSEFFSMIMLSAFTQDKDFYRQNCNRWIDKDEKFKDWYLKATFGNWNTLTARLAKATREFLSNKDMREICLGLYRNPSDEFITMLTNKGIINILFEVAELRNQWKGHGGISGEEENNQRVIKLELYLNDLRRFIAEGFEDVRMINPKGELDDGIWTFSAKELAGAKSPFREIEIKSLIGLEKKKLYLTYTDQGKPLELLPFIKYIESSDSCYFYSSAESNGVRWVSYHFEKDPELRQPIENELSKAFEFLKFQQ